MASIELHRMMCVSHDISISIVGFGDRACAWRMDTPTSHHKQTRHPSTKVSLLFDELSDSNASDDGLKYSLPFVTIQILCFICNFTSSNSYTR